MKTSRFVISTFGVLATVLACSACGGAAIQSQTSAAPAAEQMQTSSVEQPMGVKRKGSYLFVWVKAKIAPHQFQKLFANCPQQNYVVTGGGYTLIPGETRHSTVYPVVYSSKPVMPGFNAWEVFAQNNSSAQTGLVDWAVCAPAT